MSLVFLSTLTSTRRHCLLEDGNGLLVQCILFRISIITEFKQLLTTATATSTLQTNRV